MCVCRWLAGHTLPSEAVRSHPGFVWVPGLISSLPSATRAGVDLWCPEEGRGSHGGHIGAQKKDSSQDGCPGDRTLPRSLWILGAKPPATLPRSHGMRPEPSVRPLGEGPVVQAPGGWRRSPGMWRGPSPAWLTEGTTLLGVWGGRAHRRGSSPRSWPSWGHRQLQGAREDALLCPSLSLPPGLFWEGEDVRTGAGRGENWLWFSRLRLPDVLSSYFSPSLPRWPPNGKVTFPEKGEDAPEKASQAPEPLLAPLAGFSLKAAGGHLQREFCEKENKFCDSPS